MSHSVEKFQNRQWKKLDKINYSKQVIIGLVRTGSVLDIGCGDGLLLEKLKENGLEVRGIDISDVAISLCLERGLNCEQVDITERLTFADNSFDAVLLIDVLEHLFQPEDVLKEAHRITKEKVYISVPNFVSLPARIQVLLGRVPENNTSRDGHVYWMTYSVLIDLLERTGFELEEIHVNTFWEHVPLLRHIMSFLKRISPSIFALSFIIVAKKI